MFIEFFLLFVLLYLLYLPIRNHYGYFKRIGIPEAPAIPILGSLWKSTLKKVNMTDDLRRIYNSVGNERTRYIGFYNLFSPIILLKDPELIKLVTVKEFDSFSEHRLAVGDDIEPLFGKNLVALKGQRWRDMRATLSPAFTSSKIRDMCPFIFECGQQMNNYLLKQCEQNMINGVSQFEVNLRDMSTRYMNDVIANIAFGYKVDSFQDQNNEFFILGSKLTNVRPYQFMKLMFSLSFPKIGKILRLRMFSDEINNFFRNIIINNMKYRRENNIVRKDMIHLLMEAKKGSLRHDNSHPEKDAGFATVEESQIGKDVIKNDWSDDDLVAQAMLFFFGGFDTSSTLASFIIHELSLNQDVQNKLQTEVDEIKTKQNHEISYDVIHSMKYMDMVVSECLRKWPPGPFNDRLCVKDFNIGPITQGDNKTITVKKNDVLWTPVHAIHHDPKYWHNPEKFDPERFSDENKSKITPWTYLPFGAGPRNCIGSRFALMEVKIMIFYLMTKFTFVICEKTNITSELEPSAFNLKLKNGFWAKIMKRETIK